MRGPGPVGPGIDLGRKGVVWLAGTALPVERTGAERAVARIAKPVGSHPAGSPVVAAAFGSAAEGRLFHPERPIGSGQGPEGVGGVGTDAAGSLLAGGRRSISVACASRGATSDAGDRTG